MNQQWPFQPIGELFEIGAGKTMSAAARDGSNKTPFLRTSNVYWDEIDLGSVDEMSIPDHEVHAKLLRLGDLLVCEGGEIGRAAIWNGETETMSFQNHLHRLRPTDDQIEPRFYVYFLQAAFTLLGIFDGAGNKTTIPNLSRGRLASLSVPKPPLGQQRSIINLLSEIRAAIKVQKQSHRVARELKRATTQVLFTRGLRGEEQMETEVELIPRTWKQAILGDLCRTQGGLIQTGPFGSQLHKADYQESGIPVVNPTHLHHGKIEHGNIPRVSEEDARRLARHQLSANDFIFARRGQIGRMALVADEEEGWLCGTGCFLVRMDQPFIDNRFLSHQFAHEPLVAWLNTHASGAIMPNLNNAVLRRIPVFYPHLDEQRQIADILDCIDSKIDLHIRKRSALEELFLVLLQKLMTGAIQVQDLDIPDFDAEADTE